MNTDVIAHQLKVNNMPSFSKSQHPESTMQLKGIFFLVNLGVYHA